MEAVLAEHELVSQAALVVLDHGTGSRIGAAVVPTLAGRQLLSQQGRRAFTQSLTQSLQRYWAGISLLRVWRFVTRLPEDAQGKITVAALQAVFASPFILAVADAEVVDEVVSAGVAEQEPRVPETLGWAASTATSPSWPSCPESRSFRGSWRWPVRWPAPRPALERIEALKFTELLGGR